MMVWFPDAYVTGPQNKLWVVHSTDCGQWRHIYDVIRKPGLYCLLIVHWSRRHRWDFHWIYHEKAHSIENILLGLRLEKNTIVSIQIEFRSNVSWYFKKIRYISNAPKRVKWDTRQALTKAVWYDLSPPNVAQYRSRARYGVKFLRPKKCRSNFRTVL